MVADQIRQHIQSIVVAADNDDGVFNGRNRPEKFCLDRFIFLDAFQVIGNADDAVCLGEGGDASGASGKRDGDNPVIDLSQFDPEKFFYSKL